MDRVWNGWRLSTTPGNAPDGLPYEAPARSAGQSLFEAIEQSDKPEDETYIVWRGPNTFAVLNVYPYTSGHLMVLPKVAVPSIDLLDDAIHDELWRAVRDAVAAVKAAFGPDGVNVGINDGVAGGGSQPDHLHVHVVPRWRSDTNFMTTTANARLLPRPLIDTWRDLRAAWPEAGVGAQPPASSDPNGTR